MRTDSLVQSTELSNALLSTIRCAAAARSAVASTRTGTLPGPTPRAGLPERCAARTTAEPPVATMTPVTGSAIRASISGTVTSSTTLIAPSGAPARVATPASSRAASPQHSRAIGCGLTTIAFRVSRARMTLKNTLQTGLVDGVRARMTPAGRGSDTILAAASTRGLTKSSCW